jgi:hypothetical protein
MRFAREDFDGAGRAHEGVRTRRAVDRRRQRVRAVELVGDVRRVERRETAYKLAVEACEGELDAASRPGVEFCRFRLVGADFEGSTAALLLVAGSLLSLVYPSRRQALAIVGAIDTSPDSFTSTLVAPPIGPLRTLPSRDRAGYLDAQTPLKRITVQVNATMSLSRVKAACDTPGPTSRARSTARSRNSGEYFDGLDICDALPSLKV